MGKDGTRSGWLSDDGRCVGEWLCQKDAERPTADQHQTGSSNSTSGVRAAIQVSGCWKESQLICNDEEEEEDGNDYDDEEEAEEEDLLGIKALPQG